MITDFSLGQRRALALMPKLSGFVGFVFSWLIIFTVARDKKKRNKTYHRLLVGISLADASSSFWLGLSTWPMPASSTSLWAVGNDRTCNLQGFFTQFGIISSFYNASLSLYFLLVVRYNWKEARVQKIEPFLHAIPILWALVTSITSLSLGLFGNSILWCWISLDNFLYRWVFFYVPLWIMIGFVTATSFMIYQYVRQVEARTDKYRYSDLKLQMSNQAVFQQSTPESNGNVLSSPVAVSGLTVDTNAQNFSGNAGDQLNANGYREDARVGFTDSVFTPQNGTKMEPNGTSNPADSVTSSNLLMGALQQPSKMINGIRNKVSQSQASADGRWSREVATQCFWFAGAFYFNWTAMSLTRLIQSINGKVYFPLLLIGVITTPLQGLPNVIVYLGPKFMKLREELPNRSVWTLIKETLSRERLGRARIFAKDEEPSELPATEMVQTNG